MPVSGVTPMFSPFKYTKAPLGFVVIFNIPNDGISFPVGFEGGILCIIKSKTETPIKIPTNAKIILLNLNLD